MKLSIEDFLGHYSVLDERTKNYAREFVLDIAHDSKNEIRFRFEKMISGYFGSAGVVYEGLCFLRNHQLVFEAELENYWSYTFLEEEKSENVSQTSKSYFADIIREDTILKLIFHLDKRKIPPN